MASLMCVDGDLDSDSEVVNGENDVKLNVEDVLESEIQYAADKSNGTVKWLELEELDVDDDMLLSLNLSSKFPVSLPISSYEHLLNIIV